jgi:hypothetical protein
VANLIAVGVPAASIVALTFTNKAADEMRRRVAELVGPQPVEMGTFHRFAARQLRRHARQVGLTSDYSIFDPDDATAVMKRAAKKLGLALSHTPIDRIAGVISRAKNDLLTPESFEPRWGRPVDDVARKLWPVYQELLLAANAVDFGRAIADAALLLTLTPAGMVGQPKRQPPAAPRRQPASFVITGARIADGTGAPLRAASVRVQGTMAQAEGMMALRLAAGSGPAPPRQSWPQGFRYAMSPPTPELLEPLLERAELEVVVLLRGARQRAAADGALVLQLLGAGLGVVLLLALVVPALEGAQVDAAGIEEPLHERRPGQQPLTTSSSSCRRATTPSSGSGARDCPVASASASRSPARSSRIRRCCCSTRQPARSTPRANDWSRKRSNA